MKKTTSPLLGIPLAGVLALIATSAHADSFGSGGNAFVVPFVAIGNPGNGADTTGYGAVSYNFNISTYAISETDLEDAVALGAATAYGAPNLGGGAWSGNQPAASIQWYQAAAFVNWLNTSQGYAAAYNLSYSGSAWSMTLSSNPFPLGGGLFDAYRNANAYYFLPTENEYYKAAYYDPNANSGAGGYWLYATGSNTAPTAVASGTSPGTAVYNGVASQPAAVDQSGGLSPYGTMGQTGNVREWTETSFAGDNTSGSEDRAGRAAYWSSTVSVLRTSRRDSDSPSSTFDGLGFRVASVPEPSSTVLIIGPCLMFLARRRRGSSL